MFGVKHRKSWFDTEHFYSHLTHQTKNLVPSYVISSRPEFNAKLPTAIKGIAKMNLVDPMHDFHIPFADRYRCNKNSSWKVPKACIDAPLTVYAFIDQLFALVSFIRPSAVDKNHSLSTTSRSQREVLQHSDLGRSFDH